MKSKNINDILNHYNNEITENKKKLDNIIDEYRELTSKIHIHSSIKKEQLVLLIKTLIKIVEGRDFEYHNTDVTYRKTSVDCYETNHYYVSTTVDYLSESTKIHEKYPDYNSLLEFLDEQSNDQKIIPIEPSDQHITFADMPSIFYPVGANVRESYIFNQFPYVREFLDYLVLYKIENKKTELENEELINLIFEYCDYKNIRK